MNTAKLLFFSILPAILPLAAFAEESPVLPPQLPALAPRGEDFVDSDGKPVRFWGVNLVALYPDHATADALAANLASLEINLVRPHHNLRPSLDWNPKMPSGALLTYKNTSREFDTDALDRFDYLNAALRRNKIYLALSANWTRRYLPDDVDILPGDEKDRAGWNSAMTELTGWNWKQSFDVYKMLPCVDERAALLNEEFLRKLLMHVNPYTGTAYGVDPQVLTFEILNEASTEYSIICGAKFPEYWQAKLLAKWNSFAKAAGIEPGDLYKPASPEAKQVRAKFLRNLDEDYLHRISDVIRSTGCKAAITFSNLWRGDNIAEMNSVTAGYIEDHSYMDPLVVSGPKDELYDLTKSALVNKPFIVGEFNQAEGAAKIKAQSPVRTMLPVAASAYASLQNWSGIVWFAWIHGGSLLGKDGWAASEGRESQLGGIIADGMMIDHLRTTGILFRRHLVAQSRQPVTLWVDDPVGVGDYNGLMRGKYSYKPGWQDIHEIRKAFGPVPASQAPAPWMTQAPPARLVSDTDQIVKDIARRQLTVTAPQAEAFSGYLDAQAPAGLKHLQLDGKDFATSVLVSDDGKDLGASSRLILSRTAIDASNAETRGPGIVLRGLKKPSRKKHWFFVATRPRAGATNNHPRPLDVAADGSLTLPADDWHECELHLRR